MSKICIITLKIIYKLTTGIKDKRVPFGLNKFVRNGAPREILYRYMSVQYYA